MMGLWNDFQTSTKLRGNLPISTKDQSSLKAGEFSQLQSQNNTNITIRLTNSCVFKMSQAFFKRKPNTNKAKRA